MVRMASELESNCVAIERIFEYANLESEDWKSDKESSAKQFSWVKDGHIQFRNYHTRYREGLQNVLKNVNLTIDSCEKRESELDGNLDWEISPISLRVTEGQYKQ